MSDDPYAAASKSKLKLKVDVGIKKKKKKHKNKDIEKQVSQTVDSVQNEPIHPGSKRTNAELAYQKMQEKMVSKCRMVNNIEYLVIITF